MSAIDDIINSLNPENKQIVGSKAANLTRNILTNLDLSQHKPDEILSALREGGINVTIPSFYSAYTEISGATARANRIKYVNQKYTPNEGLLEPALYPLQTKYRIVQRVKYEDLETGIEIVREFVYDTNILGTIGDMQQASIEAIESKYPAQVLEISTIGGYIYSKAKS
jgi:hypothetical protein